jgi:DNA-binding transcriptional regulator of glucitol operon
MILLGRWQLIVSDEKHFSLQNFGYALQWWAFSAFTAWLWLRLVRDHASPHQPRAAGTTSAERAEEVEEPIAYRRYVMPSLQRDAAADAESDPVLAAYNDYLARLAEKDEHGE